MGSRAPRLPRPPPARWRRADPRGRGRHAWRRAAFPGTRAGPFAARDPIDSGEIVRCRARMALPRKVEFVTFDCYGTLIDWELGAYEAFQKEADRDGFTIDRNVAIPLFIEVQKEIERGSYELYAEV